MDSLNKQNCKKESKRVKSTGLKIMVSLGGGEAGHGIGRPAIWLDVDYLGPRFCVGSKVHECLLQ